MSDEKHQVHVSCLAAVLPGHWDKINTKTKTVSSNPPKGSEVQQHVYLTNIRRQTATATHTHHSHKLHSRGRIHKSERTAQMDPKWLCSEVGLFSLITVNSSPITVWIVTLSVILFFNEWQRLIFPPENTEGVNRGTVKNQSCTRSVSNLLYHHVLVKVSKQGRCDSLFVHSNSSW